jgi:hypothetical protein
MFASRRQASRWKNAVLMGAVNFQTRVRRWLHSGLVKIALGVMWCDRDLGCWKR